MRLIKKTEKPVIKNKEITEEPIQQNLQIDPPDIPEIKTDEKPELNIANQEINYVPDYISVRDNPLVQSVGNSGWQVSDIWRDLRVDSFCDW
ncbi:hypothetical protein [Nostoc sp. FACHB-190]|uniref:hypothetical protein n=1 Tax=Nostoc sp. FACHB-190 TaxID=2692838 RepID=UPI00168703DA|nr:hypothetical protein [Nostoc sp. FACHB-190]MBD2302205.1 hypothetical protein [Nostoc sp. FACHB-190]